MKKNMFSVLALAVSIINLILSILIVFTLVPSALKTNNLVSSVASYLNLEIEANSDLEDNNKNIPLTEIDVYTIEDLTLNLRREEEDTRNHYAQVTLTISFHTKHKDYKELRPQVEVYKSYVTEIITEEFAKYSVIEINESATKDKIKEDVVRRLRERFNSDFIIDMSIGKIVVD